MPESGIAARVYGEGVTGSRTQRHRTCGISGARVQGGGSGMSAAIGGSVPVWDRGQSVNPSTEDARQCWMIVRPCRELTIPGMGRRS